MKNTRTRQVEISNDNYAFLDGIRFALNMDSIDETIEYLIDHSDNDIQVKHDKKDEYKDLQPVEIKKELSDEEIKERTKNLFNDVAK